MVLHRLPALRWQYGVAREYAIKPCVLSGFCRIYATNLEFATDTLPKGLYRIAAGIFCSRDAPSQILPPAAVIWCGCVVRHVCDGLA
jgi:hypothetical protein